MGAGIPIIGLESIHALSRGQEIRHKNLMEKFMCRVCMETFTFELRGNHLGSVEHWLNYLVGGVYCLVVNSLPSCLQLLTAQCSKTF